MTGAAWQQAQGEVQFCSGSGEGAKFRPFIPPRGCPATGLPRRTATMTELARPLTGPPAREPLTCPLGGTPAMARRSADSGLNGHATPRRSDRFLEGLQDATSVTFVSHVHPDPDSLGSMTGLAHLVETRLKKPTRLTRDGVISRAENRAMVELLDIDLMPIEKVSWHDGEA